MSKATQHPASWTLAPIEAVADLNPRSFSALPGAESRTVHFVPMAAVSEEFGGIDVSRCRPLGDVRKGYSSFVASDVLFAKITPCMENGKIALVPALANHIAYGSTEFHVLRPNEAVEPKWLAYFLSQRTFREFARRNMTGSAGQMRVPTSWLSTAQVPIAPRAEQTRIVEKLEELLSDLDAGVAELKAAQKKLALYRQSLLKAAVEGALTAGWRAQRAARGEPHETGADLLARILTERRARWEARQLAKFEEQRKAPPKGWEAKYPEPMQPDTADLPELPEGWVWASVDQLSEIQGGIQKQPSRAPKENKFPFLRVANVHRGNLKLDEVHEIELFKGELERLMLQVGDVLIVEGNGSLSEIGRCALWDGSIPKAVHQNHLIRVRPIGVQGAFIEAWLNSVRGIDRITALAATTSGLYTLNISKISKVPVPVPPHDEQALLLKLLQERIQDYNQQEAAVKFGLKQATAQRKNLLKAAFSGQLVPQDPDDEPASALLARIRAEREERVSSDPARRKRRSAHA